MSIGTPTTIGTNSAVVAGTTATLTTTADIPANELGILVIGWGNSSARTLNTVTGGTTWTIDKAQTFAGAIPWAIAVVSGKGLVSSGTVITATFSGACFGALLAGCYCTGLNTTAVSNVDISDGQGQASTLSWDTTATSTTVNDTLVFGGCIHDGATTNTASGGATELHDFQFATESWTQTTEYKILSGTASTSLTGTWAASTADCTSTFVAYKMAGGAAVVEVDIPQPVIIRSNVRYG